MANIEIKPMSLLFSLLVTAIVGMFYVFMIAIEADVSLWFLLIVLALFIHDTMALFKMRITVAVRFTRTDDNHAP